MSSGDAVYVFGRSGCDGSGGCKAVEQKACPDLCPDKIVTYADGSKGGRWCNGPITSAGICEDGVCKIIETVRLNNGTIGPWAVYEPNAFGRDVTINDRATVLANVKMPSNTRVTGNVIIGGPDCNTKIGNPLIDNSVIAGDGIRIYGETKISGCGIGNNVQISGGTIYGSSTFSPNNFVTDCNILDNASIGGDVYLKYNTIRGNAAIYENATVVDSEIFGNARIYGRATVYDSSISGDARVCGNANISNIVLDTCDKRYCSDCP